MDELTLEELRSVLSYSKETGEFKWLKATGGCASPGRKAGSKKIEGYVRLCYRGKIYGAHRLAWFYVLGKWPKNEIDHRDGDGYNNRWENLREATRSENKRNARLQKNNTSGYKGVSPTNDGRRRPWLARICKDKKIIHLGSFECPKKAHEAYVKAAKELHGEFARVR